MTHQCLCL